MTLCSPNDIALLLCPELLNSARVQIRCESGPPYTTQIKDLLLQDNVSVAPHMLSEARGAVAPPPQPFPPQALLCKMRVLVIGRRRVSKRLVFLDLAPLAAAGDADVLSHVRRALWHHPRAHGQTRCCSCLIFYRAAAIYWTSNTGRCTQQMYELAPTNPAGIPLSSKETVVSMEELS